MVVGSLDTWDVAASGIGATRGRGVHPLPREMPEAKPNPHTHGFSFRVDSIHAALLQELAET